MRPPVAPCPSAWKPTTPLPLKSPDAPPACAPACTFAEIASAVISPPKIRTDETSAEARATAFRSPIVVDAAAEVAPVVITEPSLGYANPPVYAGLPLGGAWTAAVPPPVVMRMAQALADAPGV